MGETRPRCATKQVLRPLLRVPAAPFRYITSKRRNIPERYWKGKDNLPIQDSYHHSYAGSCSISAERYLQKQYLGVNNREETWQQHKQERVHFLKKLCLLTDQRERGKFLTVQLEILYGRENHLYLCNACYNSRQIDQAL